MTLSPALERFATLIADNVVSAYIRESESSRGLGLPVREIVVSRLAHALLRVLPTDDGAFLATTCNFTLADTLGGMDTRGPRVEMVDPDDGSVTMRA
ncbi:MULTISPECIES: hypothetical protein [unclassified Methylobacterium]|uniref:hypothetical protein n=1 Tax=unclassified Methylobacterium TaxID=2615210 RepID=UPI001FBBCA7F|nr:MULTISPECIES: hypothetical protein [unclassified Methylobacterium]MCJ2018326.1 hypothetical protein [Methylobacterium sp. E-065]